MYEVVRIAALFNYMLQASLLPSPKLPHSGNQQYEINSKHLVECKFKSWDRFM